MSITGDTVLPILTAALASALLAAAFVLPNGTLALVLTVLTAWACVSVPVGVLVGHCALSEDSTS